MQVSFPNKLFLCAAALAVGMLGDTRIHAQPGGVPLWTNRYSGPGGGFDLGRDVAVDCSGNVFLTGTSGDAFVTIKYSGDGVPLWTNRYSHGDATALAVDGSGNVFVTGHFLSGTSDYVTIKYSGAGVALWANRYHEPANGVDIPNAVAVDGSGNVFVTGVQRAVFNGPGDYATIKYSSTGVPLWTNLYNGPGNGEDQAIALAVDGSGNVFVTGYSWSGNWTDYATIKYSGDGAPLWTNRYHGPGNYGDAAHAVAVDGSGDVVVTGFSNGTDGIPDYATIKYSSAGVPAWTNRYNGPGNYGDEANAVAVDGSGNVFVTGSSYGSGSDEDFATIKYSSAGVPLWTNRYNGYDGNCFDGAIALAVDSAGNVFVTGYSYITNLFHDYATIAYSSSGVPLWTNRYRGPGNIAYAHAYALAVDRTGNVFVTGYSYVNDSDYDYVTIKYSSMGGPLLTIARTTTNTLAVSWSSPAADFTLQQNNNVASTNWMAVGIIPADDGTNKTVIVDPPEGNRFYRLFRP